VHIGASAIGVVAFVVVLGIVLLRAFSFVEALGPEFMLALIAIITVLAIFGIVVVALAFKNRD